MKTCVESDGRGQPRRGGEPRGSGDLARETENEKRGSWLLGGETNDLSLYFAYTVDRFLTMCLPIVQQYSYSSDCDT